MEEGDFYDFNNVLTETKCSTGIKRVPLDLFENYDLIHASNVKGVTPMDDLRNLKTFNEEVSKLDFPVHLYTRADLIEIMLLHFKSFDLIKIVSPDGDETILKNLIRGLAARYQRSPYHHFTHACFLMHLSSWCLRQLQDWNKYLTHLDILSIFITCLLSLIHI